MLYPQQIELSLKSWRAVMDAYKVGRSENTEPELGLLPYLEYDESQIRAVLETYAAAHDTVYIPSGWTAEGEYPELNLAKQKDPGAGQTLVLTMGVPGTRLDIDESVQKILDVYDHALDSQYLDRYAASDFTVLVPEPVTPLDMQDICEELSVAPVDDSLDMETYQIVTGSYGYGFDLEAARKQVEKAQYGDVLEIPMVLTEPEIVGEEVYFRDLLGYCETPHSNNEDRNHNLAKACAAMDGMILQPGEVFSYNETLGERTKENGWKRAGAYSGVKLVQSYGGGICQVSSTIYCATLYADLEIVFRINHGIPVSYMDYGLDATVSWNGPDYQFRNNTHFPVKIAAEVSDGYVKVGLWGTEERDYYVEMETKTGWSDDFIYARSYKCKYDRETGELISRDLEARSNYMR